MRTLRLARHLDAAGWAVDVVTAAPERFRAGTVTDPGLLERVPERVRVTRARAWRPVERLVRAIRPRRRHGVEANPRSAAVAGAPVGPSSNVRWMSRMVRAGNACLALPDREVSWLVPAVAAGWRVGREYLPDVIYSSGPPFTAHLVGAALARLLGRRWVADFRDPWARAPWREDRFAFERRAWAVLERAVVTRADAVLFVTETNRQDFAQHYGPAVASRFHVIPNGCDVSDFDGLAKQQALPGDRFVLLHAGSLYGARDPSPLLRALARLIETGSIARRGIRVRFIGRASVTGVNLPELARDLALHDVVEFVNHLPRRAVLQQMLNASALLIVQPVTTVSVPAKLYEYMAAGRPVLALVEPGGETDMLVNRSGAGIAVAADDEHAIERALVALVSGSYRHTPVAPGFFDGNQRAETIANVLGSQVSGGVSRASAGAVA